MGAVFFLYKSAFLLFFSKIAIVKSARIFAIKILIPIPVFEKIQEPVRVTANANPGLTQNSASFCASLREIELFLYNAAAFFTPTGYPPVRPVNIA